MYLFRTFLLKALLLFLVLPLPTWGGAVITYHGRILDVQKQPVESNLVNFRVRVYSPNPSKCLLYEEVRSVDMSNSQGVFVIPIGDGLGTRTAADPGLTIEKIFNNDPTYTFDTTNTPKLVCNSGVSFTADPLDQRLLAVSFDDNSGLGEQTLPLMDINFVPLAVNAYDAQNIGGAPANSVLRVQGGTASPLTPAYFSELINLITGVSTQYERVGRLNGQAVPALANGQVLGWNGGWTAVTPLTSFTESDPSVKTFAKTDLPACTGSSFYQNDGSGNLACASGNYITTMTGDVTSSGFTAGSVSTTIANNAINSAKISDGAILGTDMSFAGVNTATSNLVIKDSTGKFFDFSCGTAGHVATWTVAGWACQNPGSGVSGSGTVDTVPLFSAASTLADSPIVVSSGNVGIGTTPYGILHAGKDQNAMTIFYLSNYDAGASAGSKVVIEGDMNSFTLQKNSFAQANSGHSKSDGAIVHTGGAGGISITASNPSGGIRFYTAGTSDASERMVISSSGKVGIGALSPAAKLDVAGTLKVGNGGELCSALGAGGFRFNAGAMEFCDGTSWTPLSAGASDLNSLSDAVADYTSNNLAIGQDAGTNLAAGSGANVLVGASAGNAMTTAADNVAIGFESGVSTTSGSYNAMIGSNAGWSNTTGIQHTFVGYYAGSSNTTASSNTMVGAYAGQSTTTGGENTFLGINAGDSNQTGSRNVAIGGSSLGMFRALGASYNTAVGNMALLGQNNLSSGTQNSALGASAGKMLTTGSNNIFIGFQSGEALTTGNNNIVIGHDIDLPTDSSSNMLNIGNLVYATGVDGTGTALSSGNVGIGIEAPAEKLDVVGNIKTSGCIYYASSSLGTCASDERIKTDVQPFDLGLDALLGINPVQFKYNGLAGFKADGKEQLGVIAQDVEKVAPKLVKTEMVMLSPKDQEKTQIKVVDYGAFTYVIINAVKELYAKVVSLEGSQSTLKTDSELLDKKIKQLELDIQTRDQRIKDLEDRLIRVEQTLTSK